MPNLSRNIDPELIYSSMYIWERELIARERRLYSLPIAFVAGPLSAPDEFEQIHNLLRLGSVIVELSSFYDLRCANQTRHHFLLNPHDPGNLDIKFDVFYKEVIRLCDLVLVLPGWENSSGCQREVEYARQLGKSIYTLDSSKLRAVHELRPYLEKHWPLSPEDLSDLLDFSGDWRRDLREGSKPITFLGKTIFNRRPDWRSIVTALP